MKSATSWFWHFLLYVPLHIHPPQSQPTESLQNSISHFTFPCLTSQCFTFFFHLPILFLISPTPELTANVLEMGTLATTVPTTSDIGLDNICQQIHGSLDKPNVLVQILTSLSQLECRKIREEYKRIYEEDLVQVCQNTEPEVSFLSSLMLNPSERDANFARRALERNPSVDYKALIEIFTCRKSSHVMLILEAYRLKYRSHLVLDIAAIEPSHPYQKMLMALSASHKAHNAEISQHIAKCDARRLYQTGEGKAGAIDEAVVLEILSKRSIPQIKLTLFTYNHIYGHSYTAFLKSKDLGDFEDVVRVVATCIYNPSKYFAKNLHECLKGTTTNDKGALVRIMVSRAERQITGDFLLHWLSKASTC
ncbi:annexin D8-like isoform X2 [Primulina tabacum]|uniref:annexin D8-like isoform X2 n=1 Tax=Primulina tabacum TaxID=48773 RepID=UPI003F5AD2D2